MWLMIEIPDSFTGEGTDSLARLMAWYKDRAVHGDGTVVTIGPPGGPVVFASRVLDLQEQ